MTAARCPCPATDLNVAAITNKRTGELDFLLRGQNIPDKRIARASKCGLRRIDPFAVKIGFQGFRQL